MQSAADRVAAEINLIHLLTGELAQAELSGAGYFAPRVLPSAFLYFILVF